MNNYDKYLATKPEDFRTARDIADQFAIPIRKVQDLAKILRIEKDSSGIYVFNEEGLKKFKRLLKLINYKNPKIKQRPV